MPPLQRTYLSLCLICFAVLFFIASISAQAQEGSASAAKEYTKHDLTEISAKLANPTSDVWALFTQFALTVNDGDVNKGRSRITGNITFEPILPFPLHGTGNNAWKLIVRPAVPLSLDQSIPKGFDSFDHKTGLGDTLLPMLVSPPVGNWILGLGPTLTLPTATERDLGRKQWAMGPAGIFGYKTKKITVLTFPQYFWKVGSAGQGDMPDANYMSLLYVFAYNLPHAWQLVTNPTITYDRTASSGNKWNVPVGLGVAKTTRIGKIPVKFQLAAEYSVINQDDYGQRFLLKLNVIPVIPPLIKNPLFGE